MGDRSEVLEKGQVWEEEILFSILVFYLFFDLFQSIFYPYRKASTPRLLLSRERF